MPALLIPMNWVCYTPNKNFKILILPLSNVEWLLAAAGCQPHWPAKWCLNDARHEWSAATADNPDASWHDAGADDEERDVLSDEGPVHFYAPEWPSAAD